MNGIGGGYTRATPKSDPALVERTKSTEDHEAEQLSMATGKTPLTHDELVEVWKLDQYWGLGGSYLSDPYTGKRTLKED